MRGQLVPIDPFQNIAPPKSRLSRVVATALCRRTHPSTGVVAHSPRKMPRQSEATTQAGAGKATLEKDGLFCAGAHDHLQTMQSIPPPDLIPMDIFVGREPVEIDLVYANANHPHNIFGKALYHDKSKLWAHKDIAAITLLAARILQQKTSCIFSLKDCLRTTDAQTAMGNTQIVKENPDWLKEPNRMVSPQGSGAHPRGMAIDVCVLDSDGREIDMGTHFDEMDPKSYRNCDELPSEALGNRQLLEDSFVTSAKALGFDFLPLPEEWWDFRFPRSIYSQYEPLSDKDLPPQMQMTGKVENSINDFMDSHFQALADNIILLVDKRFSDL